ncbi:hypothetical protein HK104_007614, partial [Borealophlyctis nickersoniae]
MAHAQLAIYLVASLVYQLFSSTPMDDTDDAAPSLDIDDQEYIGGNGHGHHAGPVADFGWLGEAII